MLTDSELRDFDYADFDDFWFKTRISLTISEVHGFITGYMCCNKKSTASDRRNLYGELLAADSENAGRLDDEIVRKLDLLFNTTLENLDEYGDYKFRILMPPDEANINHRMRALRDFCNGFISSLGSMPLDEEISEILIDMRNIAAVRDEMEGTEENESDFFQLVEFVRASVFFIFFEATQRK